MKSSKIDRIISVVVISTCLIKAVLYGGSKPPSTTNEPPSDISGDIPTNPPPMMCMSPRPMMSPPPPQQTEPDNLCSPSPSTFTSITSWNKRGAYCDWLRVDFPDSFEFPYGTNMLNGLTLMAYGELRENLHCSPSPSTFTLNLPQQVSIEPDVSSVVHGLTPSNSYLFTWQNVCVNRDPTNRVDASIELFDSGAIETTVTSLSTPTPPTYTYQPAVPPAGFVGEGQDDDWLATAFPSHYAAITNGGYAAWLSDYIGHNEPNGRYKVSVTISSLPDHGPCYLVVGPYKMVVTVPGTYSFPLEVFETYKAFTCPTHVPLSFAYDDGYRIEPDPSLFMSPMMARARSPQEELEYELRQIPTMNVCPGRIGLNQIGNTPIQILCNMPGAIQRYYTWSLANVELVFLSQTEAEIVNAASDCLIEIEYRNGKGSVSGYCEIYSSLIDIEPDPPSTNEVDDVNSTTNAPPPVTPPDVG